MSNRAARSRADKRPPPDRKRTGNGSARADVMDREIGLDALAGHAGYAVRRFQIWIFQDFIRRLSRIDISPAQFSVLVIIGANEGLSQSELGATLGIERARLVRMLHLLDRRGLTERLPSSADGRRHALRLTRAGQVQLKQAKALAAQHEASLLSKLGPERYRLMLEALREAN